MKVSGPALGPLTVSGRGKGEIHHFSTVSNSASVMSKVVL